MKLNVNLAEVPDKVPVVDPGQYTCDIVKVGIRDASGDRKAALEIQLKITDSGPNQGKILFESFPLDFLDNPNHMVTVKFGHMVKSTGLPMSSEFDTESLLGKSVQVIVKHENYKDKQGEEQTSARVKEYLSSN